MYNKLRMPKVEFSEPFYQQGSNPTGPTELPVQVLPKSKNKRSTDFLNNPNNKNH
jgi:hypothetical protein